MVYDSILERVADFATIHNMKVEDGDYDTNIITVGGRKFLCLDKDKVFSTDMKLILTDYDKAEAEGSGADYVFEFGGNYYWTSRTSKEVEFNDFRYIGNCVQELDMDFAHLGVHGGYEIMGGSGRYEDWCKKAKFLGHKALGICEMNTLAGAVAFQNACNDAKIKPIIGMTISVQVSTGLESYNCKIYAKNASGWRNMLRIHKKINVEYDSNHISIDDLVKNCDGLVIILGWGFPVDDRLVRVFNRNSASVFYQIDSVIYVDSSHDLKVLNNVKGYLGGYISDIEPVLINDTYYIDFDYAHIKAKLNSSSGKFVHKTTNTHYKSLDESFKYLSNLFEDDDERLYMLIDLAALNSVKIAEECSFKIETGVVKMPKFECDKLSKEYSEFTESEDLFWHLIGEGMERLSPNLTEEMFEKYQERIEMETNVIKNGGFIDYFLVVWDILKWSQLNGIYTGIGRGSAGGCLIAYLLDITRIDPIEYNLPFERFMNAGRLAGSLPDIDSDFEGLRRDDVKRYIESKYGADYVCSIGSYSKLRVKAAMNEMWTDKSKIGTLKYMTAMIQDRDGDWDEIFRSANKKKQFKEFVLENVDFINNVRLVLDQPKNTSIHAAGVVIVPKFDSNGEPMTIFDWMPVTKRDGVLVSEWEGTYLEKCGFMKNDILGTRQMDKFRYITDLIKKTTGDDIDIYSIPTNDKAVFGMFEQGFTEDTFHFGSKGLKAYVKTVKPVVIDDLIDTISLHRPALMDIGAHKDFVSIRDGRSKPHYDFMLEGITKSTNGIIVYQEQVMEAARDIGGFTMQEADDVRRAMGKKKIEVIAPYKSQFVEGAIKRGCPPQEADALWNKLELFSGYGFNRSHATAYAMTGYVGMWLKVHYPLQFWTAAFKYAGDEDIPRFMSEMNSIGKVKVSPPDINTSSGDFITDYENSTINWALNKIKQVGDIATDDIIEERDKNGKFFSVEELFKRVTRKKVNRKVITAMVFAGCMDKLYNVKKITDRLKILKEYAKLIGESVTTMVNPDKADAEYWWATKQKMVSGLGVFDYESISKSVKFEPKLSFMSVSEVHNDNNIAHKCAVSGIVMAVDPHTAGRGEFANILLDNNNEQLWVTCWNDAWMKLKPELMNGNNEVKILFITGRVAADSFKNQNVVETINGTKFSVVETGVIGKSLEKS